MAERSGYCECGCGGRTRIAKRTYGFLGVKKGQPHRFITGHQHHKSGVEFEEDPTTGCWLWQRGRTSRGYGVARRDGEPVYAHRALWEEFFGPMPPGAEMDHLCENPPCCNPGHVEPVTDAENKRRFVERARAEGRTVGAVTFSS